MKTTRLIEVENLSKHFTTSSGDYSVLRNISFSVEKGKMVAVIGKSGSGKSTLLNMLTGIDHPSSGEVRINGLPIHTLDESRLATWRGGNIGIVFQFFQLIPTLTVLENLLLAMEFVNKIPRVERITRARGLLERVDILQHANKFPSTLSGGEQQRAAIARALANDPPILIADEPTGNLDSATTMDIQNLFVELAKQGKTVIVVTHDNVQGVGYDRVISLIDGVIEREKEAA